MYQKHRAEMKTLVVGVGGQDLVLTHPGEHFYITAAAMCEVKPPEVSKNKMLLLKMTNGGKSTLAMSLHQQIPNSCIIAQDSYFKDESVVPEDSNGFKQYDTLDALHMDVMMSDVDLWRRDPESFLRQRDLNPEHTAPSVDKEVFVLIVEGFLIFNYRPLNELFNKRFFMEIPYEVCKRRRSLRVYTPPDPPGYFDGHVWPMYLKNHQEMETMVSGIVFLDGLKPREELLAAVCKDVCQEIERLREKD